MKRLHFLLTTLAAFCAFSTVIAQKDSSGIYKTSDDFKQRKLSYAVNYKTQTHKINADILFNNADIKVTHDGEIHTLLKSETYGYRSTKGQEFRFIENKEYEILNPDQSLLMYVYKHPSHSPKEAEKYAPAYFFSVNAASAPQSLTKANLKAAYPDRHKFHDGLDVSFKSDAELYTYDQFHKMYKLNRIMKTTMN